MTIQTSTLRPGLLVSLKTSTRGNVSYEKRDLEDSQEENVELKKWETSRTIADLQEWERSKKARSGAVSAVRKVCAWSAFGLLCPESDKEDLDAAVNEARRIVDEFNATAQMTRVHVFVMVGKIAADDVEAVRAINSEVRDLMRDMEDGLKKLDVKTVREAAQKAKSLGQMLTPEAEGRVTKAIELAREAAKKIVKAGEEGTVEIDTRAIRKIAEQRTSFLDMDDVAEIQKPTAKVRAVDLSDEDKAYNAENIKRGKEIDKKRRKADREATPPVEN